MTWFPPGLPCEYQWAFLPRLSFFKDFAELLCLTFLLSKMHAYYLAHVCGEPARLGGSVTGPTWGD